jgi:hypothetical protein
MNRHNHFYETDLKEGIYIIPLTPTHPKSKKEDEMFWVGLEDGTSLTILIKDEQYAIL